MLEEKSEALAMHRYQIIPLLLLLSCSLAFAQAHRVIPVRFSQGASEVTLVEGVARGETATFVLDASKGQKMRVVCDSIEDNAEFDVVSAGGWELGHSRHKNGQQVWYGALPHSGPNHVIVGNTRGGSEITITFEIH